MPESILIVGEEPARSFAKSVLQSEGYTLFEAENSLEALLFCAMRSGPVELLMAQIDMPGIDGRALREKFRQRFPAVPVVYLSGQADVLRAEVRRALEPARKPAGIEGGVELERRQRA